MLGSRRAFVVGAVASLAECGPQAPQYQDALADIARTRTGDDPIA
jgi:hypothetical protein